MRTNSSPTKRSWGIRGFIIGVIFGTILAGFGIAAIVATLTVPDVRDRFSPVAMGTFLILGGIALYIVSICSLLRVRRWQRRFIAAFVADEATNIYRDRQAAALKLWKLVRRCVQLASPTLKLRMVYSHEWLIKYRSELEEFR